MESQKNRFFVISHLLHGKGAAEKYDEAGIHCTGILDRFLKDATYREAQHRLLWTEAKCKEMDALAQKDQTYMDTKEELERYRSMWTLQLNDPTYSGPPALRPDYKAAVSLKNHLYRHSEDYQRPIPAQVQFRQRRGCQFSDTYRQSPQIDPTTGWKIWPQSSSFSSRWQSDNWDEWHCYDA